MNESRRQRRVSSLIKEELSRLFIDLIQDSSSGLITITRVEISKDLKTAYVYLSLFGFEDNNKVLEFLERRKGFLRKSVASRTELKYNPMLIFSLDRIYEYEEKIDKIIKNLRENEKRTSRSDKQKDS
jgi:ribosome-binding factor A